MIKIKNAFKVVTIVSLLTLSTSVYATNFTDKSIKISEKIEKHNDKEVQKQLKIALKLTEEYTAPFEQVDVNEELSSEVEFGTSKQIQNEGEIGIASYSNLAVGKTQADYYDGTRLVTSQGNSEGKYLVVVTSATTSLWYNTKLIAQGEEDHGLGKVDAYSSISYSALGRYGQWTGITFHTATDGFDFYEAKTKDVVHAY
jgi:hypothetical protein